MKPEVSNESRDPDGTLPPPLHVVAGAIVRDGQVLAAQRGPGSHLAGLWELPGGKVEAGESDAHALQRELVEELGVDVRVGEHLGEVVHAYPQRTVRLVAYACYVRAGEPVAHEHSALRWVGPDDLEALPWAPADIPLLDAVRQLLAFQAQDLP